MTATTTTKPQANGAQVDPSSVRVKSAKAMPKESVNRWSDRPKTGKVKVFVWLQNEDGSEFEGVSYNAAPQADDFTSNDEHEAATKAFWSRENRRWTANRREVLNQVAAALNLDLGKVRFSRNAGCSTCPCSPGFTAETTGQHDLFVTATARPAA